MDVYAPCALGATINANTVAKLMRKVICGAANNQPEDDEISTHLEAMGVTYAPDGVGNAGGFINLSFESGGNSRAIAMERLRRVYDNVLAIFSYADRERIPSVHPAELLCQCGQFTCCSERRLGQSYKT